MQLIVADVVYLSCTASVPSFGNCTSLSCWEMSFAIACDPRETIGQGVPSAPVHRGLDNAGAQHPGPHSCGANQSAAMKFNIRILRHRLPFTSESWARRTEAWHTLSAMRENVKHKGNRKPAIRRWRDTCGSCLTFWTQLYLKPLPSFFMALSLSLPASSSLYL